MDDKPLHGLEMGLPVQTGARPLPVAGTQPERGLNRIAKLAGLDRVPDQPIPGLKPKIHRNDRPDARRHPGSDCLKLRPCGAGA